MNNLMYDKVKLLHELGCLIWFIDKHACKDAEQEADNDFHQALQALSEDLKKHMQTIKASLCKKC